MKVFKEGERNRKLNEHVRYSESYEVKFWIKEGEFWKQRSEMYYTENKGAHDFVVDRWRSDYSKYEVDLINVIYQ